MFKKLCKNLGRRSPSTQGPGCSWLRTYLACLHGPHIFKDQVVDIIMDVHLGSQGVLAQVRTGSSHQGEPRWGGPPHIASPYLHGLLHQGHVHLLFGEHFLQDERSTLGARGRRGGPVGLSREVPQLTRCESRRSCRRHLV